MQVAKQRLCCCNVTRYASVFWDCLSSCQTSHDSKCHAFKAGCVLCANNKFLTLGWRGLKFQLCALCLLQQAERRALSTSLGSRLMVTLQ